MADKKENRIITLEDEIRAKLLEGAQATYDAVGLSYGPRGKNVLVEKGFGRPIVTRDGVTIARDIFFSDRARNAGSQLITEAAESSNRIAGDGTTATTVLSYYLLKNSVQAIAAGNHPMEIKDILTQDGSTLLASLEPLVKPVKDEQLKEVATVSAGDPLIGQLIAEAILYVGQDGGILTEKAPIANVEREYVDGYYIQSGFTALPGGKKELEDPFVIVSSKRITSAALVTELITKALLSQGVTQETIQRTGKVPTLLFIGNFEDAAYLAIVGLINKGMIDAIVVKTPPQFGDMGKELLGDIATYTNCLPITESVSIKDFDASYVGKVDRVITSKSESTLFADHETQAIIERIADIRQKIEVEDSPALVEKLKDRVAKLEGKICLFKIGGTLETEKEELEYRIEDAINSTRNAYNEGIVAGGGVTFLELSKIPTLSDISRNALRDTFKKLLENANLPVELKLNEALNAPSGHGFNLRKGGKLVDMVKEGVIDPVVVVREVVKNSISAISTAITIGAGIIFEDQEK